MSTASAQIFVSVRPVHAVVVRTAAPSPRHVWIDEDWQERDGRYEYNGGRWAEPPHEGYRYYPGHWDHNGNGHRWREGNWKPEHLEGGPRGHSDEHHGR